MKRTNTDQAGVGPTEFSAESWRTVQEVRQKHDTTQHLKVYTVTLTHWSKQAAKGFDVGSTFSDHGKTMQVVSIREPYIAVDVLAAEVSKGAVESRPALNRATKQTAD